jgi:phosphate transport system protein
MFSIFRDADQLESVEQQLLEMLASCQDAFRLATGCLLGDGDVASNGEAVRALDKDINRLERAIRRELLIHGTVRGAEVDQGLMLTYMSLAKDAERIGDKCKDIMELAQMGADFTEGDDVAELLEHRNHVAELIKETRETFAEQDTERVHELINLIEEDEDQYDRRVTKFVMSDLKSRYAAPRALFYRYIKRISGHLSNILSSVVMPVDRLDFYNPEKAIDESDED